MSDPLVIREPVLSDAQTRLWAQRALQHVASLSAALIFLLPFTLALHRRPQPIFDSEWVAGVLLGLLAITIGAQRARAVTIRLPLPLWLVAMVAVAAAQFATGALYYSAQLSLACIYAFAIFGAYWAARALFEVVAREKVVGAIAAALAAGAVFSVAIQWLQLFDVRGLPDWLYLQIDDAWYRTRPFGNMAQANHLATYLVWALLATVYLHRRSLKLPATIALCLIVAVGLALTRSRMGAMLAIVPVAACWLPSALRPIDRRDRFAISLCMLIGYVAGSMVVSTIVAFKGVAVDTAIGRFGEGGGFSIRLGMWRDALEVAFQHPFFGAGFGQYAVAQFGLAEPHGVSTNYAHNVVLQTAAELGWPLAIALALLGSWWATAQFKQRMSVRETALAWALLAVLACHGLLEWPLSSLHYAIPAAFLYALSEPNIFARFASARLSSRMLLLAGVVGLILAATMKLEFDEISEVNYLAEIERKSKDGLSDDTARRLVALSNASLLRIYADQMLVTLRSPGAVEATDEEIERHERVLIFGADARVLARLAILNAKAGNIRESVRYVDRLRVFSDGRYDTMRRLILESTEKLGAEADPVRRHLAEGAPATGK